MSRIHHQYWYAVGYVDRSVEKDVQRLTTPNDAYSTARQMGQNPSYHHADFAIYVGGGKRTPPRYKQLETFTRYQPNGAKSRGNLLALIADCGIILPPDICFLDNDPEAQADELFPGG